MPKTGLHGLENSAILRQMLGEEPAPAAGTATAFKASQSSPDIPFAPPFAQETQLEPLSQSPSAEAAVGEQEAVPPPYRESMAQGLLQLATEAEKHAAMAAQAADQTNTMAQELIDSFKVDGDRPLQQLGLSACKNAYYAADAAMQAQVSALQTYGAAVNQILADLEAAKDAMQERSTDIVLLSKNIAQAQEEAVMAHDKAELAQLEYTAKQSNFLSSRKILAKAQENYVLNHDHMRQSHEKLEIAQRKTSKAQQEYLRLKKLQEKRRQQWQNMQKNLTWPPEQETPQPTAEPEPMPETGPTPGLLPVVEPMPAAAIMPKPVLESLATPVPEPIDIRPLTMFPFQPLRQDETLPAEEDALTLADSKLEPLRKQVTAIPFAAPLPAPEEEKQALVPAIAVEAARPAVAKASKVSRLWQYTKVLVVALVIVICLRLFVFDVALVEGVSMEPTLQPMDSLISSKISYKLHDPQRFDIILLDAPDESGLFIKRIVGLPNEHIQITDGQVFINGSMLNEDFLQNVYTDGNINTVIPDGYYFVMGDNRPASHDSRAADIGLIARDKIDGKAIFRFYPFSAAKAL